MKNFITRLLLIRPGKKSFAIPAFIFCLSLAAIPSFGQNTLDLAGLTPANPATVAYGLRKLSSSYGGPAVRIRRSSDNTSQDIGFSATGHLDTITLKTFVGGGNGFVTTWYDQSGNNTNLTQLNNANQPVLVANGIVNRENNKPFIRFWGVVSVSHHSLNLPGNMTTVGHVAAVLRFVPGGYGFILSSGGTYNWHGSSPNTNFLIHASFASASVRNGQAWQDGNPVAPLSFAWPTSLTLAEFAPATPSVATDWNNLGNDRNCCHFLSGGSGYGELVIFNAALSTVARQALETNQRTYFSIGVTLPVSWQSFTVSRSPSGVNIQWVTAHEENSREFIVQRSTNGSSWSDIAIVAAAGNSSDRSYYQVNDNSISPGLSYYRILQRDWDGKTSHSEIRHVQFESNQPGFIIIAKPTASHDLRLQLNKRLELSLYNSNGQLAWIKQLGAGIHSVDVKNFPKGIYFLKAGDQTGKLLLQ